MTRFLVISDPHFHLWNYGDTVSRLNNDLLDLTAAIVYGRQHNVDALLFCGDIFHTHGTVSAVVLSRLFETLSKYGHFLKEKAIFIPGNHDLVYKNRSDATSICFLEHFGRVIYSPQHISIKNFPILHACPYTEDELTLNLFLEQCTPDSIVMLHQGVSGVEVNSKGFTLNELLKPNMIPDHILHAFTGHYHSKKSVSPKLTIPGALVQHNFGDANDERGFLDVTINNKDIEILFIPSQNHYKFKKIKFTESIIDEFNQIKRTLFDEVLAPQLICIEDIPINKLTELKRVLDEKGVSAKLVTRKTEDTEFQKTNNSFKTLESMLERYIDVNRISDDLSKLGKSLVNETTELRD